MAVANSAYLEELRRDAGRREGSGAQELRREKHQQDLRDEVQRCERALAEARLANNPD